MTTKELHALCSPLLEHHPMLRMDSLKRDPETGEFWAYHDDSESQWSLIPSEFAWKMMESHLIRHAIKSYGSLHIDFSCDEFDVTVADGASFHGKTLLHAIVHLHTSMSGLI